MILADIPARLRCPLCLERFAERSAEGPLVRCGGCKTITHQACRHELGPCPVLGCPSPGDAVQSLTTARVRWRKEPPHHFAEFAALTTVLRRHSERFLIALLLGVAYVFLWPAPQAPTHGCNHSGISKEIKEKLSLVRAMPGER